MGSSDTAASTRALRTIAVLVIVAGAVFAVAGVVTWFVVRDQLADENITVSDDADRFAGDPVDGPLHGVRRRRTRSNATASKPATASPTPSSNRTIPAGRPS